MTHERGGSAESAGVIEPGCAEAGRGWRFSRREMLGLVGATFALAACSSSTSSPIKAVTGGSTSGSAGATGRQPVARIGGSHVPAGQAISVSDAQRLAAEADGHWQGGWHDDAGRSGTSDVTISIETASRTARASVAFSGNVLGSPLEAQTYQIDLLSFMLAADSYDVESPQLGKISIVPGGATSATATAHSIPGHPEIATIEVNGGRVAHRVDVSYTVHYTDGHTVKGTMAWTSAAQRATPAPLPTPGAAPNPADVQTGSYAASLLTGADLTAIFGAPFPTPTPNGGRLQYDAGIDVSNANARGGGYDVSYSVYIGQTAATTAAFWKKQSLGLPSIAGTWKAAFWLSTPPSLYVYATDNRVLLIQVQPANGSNVPTPAQINTWKQLTEKIAAHIVTTLGTR